MKADGGTVRVAGHDVATEPKGVRAAIGVTGQFAAVDEPMRQGGVSAICLAVVSDSPIIKLTDGRLRPSRDPRPGELYDFTRRAFEQLHALAREQRLPILRTSAELRAARASHCAP